VKNIVKSLIGMFVIVVNKTVISVKAEKKKQVICPVANLLKVV